jgi:hypothetical protein
MGGARRAARDGRRARGDPPSRVVDQVLCAARMQHWLMTAQCGPARQNASPLLGPPPCARSSRPPPRSPPPPPARRAATTRPRACGPRSPLSLRWSWSTSRRRATGPTCRGTSAGRCWTASRRGATRCTRRASSSTPQTGGRPRGRARASRAARAGGARAVLAVAAACPPNCRGTAPRAAGFGPGGAPQPERDTAWLGTT